MDICQQSDSCSDDWAECTSLDEQTSNDILSIDENIDDKINKNNEIIENIKKRSEILKDTMSLLNQQLNEEMLLLKRYQDEYKHQLYQAKILEDFKSSTLAAKAASDAYIAEINNYSSGTLINQSNISLKNDFQIKLEQVKRLVDNEMTNIRDCGDSLKPLNQMMSRWSFIGIKQQKSNFHENISTKFHEITGN